MNTYAQQYAKLKKQVGDAILLLRIGDFYETFYDDAVLCSKVLGVTLSTGSESIPLAGIPSHSLDGYIDKLVAAGHRVSVSEAIPEGGGAC